MFNETRKIMHSDVKCSAMCVRISALRSHSEAVWIETEEPLDVRKVQAALASAPGVTLKDDPEEHDYPMPLYTAGKDNVYVGRVRKDLANDKVRFSERRINDTYFANVSKCVDSSSGDTDEIKEQRRQCIMKAKQQRDKEFADLPSPEDCEASSAGTKSDSPEADAGKEASAKAAPSKAAPKKKK